MRFYDEREWRWVPAGPDTEWLEREVWQDPERLAEVHRIISLQHPLRFEANDVRYLLVQGEDDVVPLLGALKTGHLDDGARELLSSRIVTAAQLSEDF